MPRVTPTIDAELLSKLTLDEKVHVMSGNATWLSEMIGLLRRGKRGVYNFAPYDAGGVPRLGIPAVKFVDGPRGVVCGASTCFPVAMARGASWDVELEDAVGEAIGKELRAHGGNFFGGVCVNLLRHPAWGRAQETYGEDPHHVGAMGSALTRGVQRHNVMACVKHYALNSMENMRFKVDVSVDERTLREVYLPHFRACIVEAGAASVMSAYNKVRGTYCGEHDYLLNTILRDEWGFDGFVVSDFVWGTHDAERSVRGGLDVEMHIKRKFGALKSAVTSGRLPEAELDRAVSRVVKKTVAFTTRPDPQSYPTSLIACDEHVALARRAAEESMVLLKNADATLPFDLTSVRRVAVIGALAKQPNLGDHGSSHVRPPAVRSPLDGVRAFLAGKAEVLYDNGKDVRRAAKLAAEVDAVVLVVGCGASDEGEYIVNLPGLDSPFMKRLGVTFGGDRDELSLKPRESELVTAVAQRNARCCVAVVAGSAVTMEGWREQAPAILMMWYAGMEGGMALARTVFGATVPSGKLPFSIPERASDLPPFNKRATEVEYGYFHGYTLLEKNARPAAFPFGHGLSYTSFSFHDFKVEPGEFSLDGTAVCRVRVQNDGKLAAKEVVQLYAGAPASKRERPLKKLVAFEKTNVEPGQSVQVTFHVPWSRLATYDTTTSGWDLERTDYTFYAGGTSETAALLTNTTHV